MDDGRRSITRAHLDFCLFDLILNVPVNNLSVTVFLGRTNTKLGLMCLAQGHNAVTPVRLKPASLRSRVKHSTPEPLHSLAHLEPLAQVCQKVYHNFSSFQFSKVLLLLLSSSLFRFASLTLSFMNIPSRLHPLYHLTLKLVNRTKN